MSWEEKFAEDMDPAGAKKRTVTVGWTVRAPHAQAIWGAPKLFERSLPRPASAKSVQACPAAVDFDKRHYVIPCPVDLTLRFDRAQNGVNEAYRRCGRCPPLSRGSPQTPDHSSETPGRKKHGPPRARSMFPPGTSPGRLARARRRTKLTAPTARNSSDLVQPPVWSVAEFDRGEVGEVVLVADLAALEDGRRRERTDGELHAGSDRRVLHVLEHLGIRMDRVK